MIDRVALHGTPGNGLNTILVHPVLPYEGPPKLSVELQTTQLDGCCVYERKLTFFYLYTDEHGTPHYTQRSSPGRIQRLSQHPDTQK